MVFPVVGGDGKPTGYDIDNSLRLDDGGSERLYFDPSSNDSTRTKYTFSTWVKLGNLATSQQRYFFGAGDHALIGFRAGSGEDDDLYVQTTAGGVNAIQTNAKFRDPSAWYHIYVKLDTTQSTASDRLKLYVNGVEVTSFSVDQRSNITQDSSESDVGSSGERHNIGYSANGSGSFYDGYMADTHLLVGTVKSHTDFGEFNDNGVWIPIKTSFASSDYGTNGFKLEYKQTGTSANSSGIGADTSGNDNHFTVQNLNAQNVTTDTPTNNFCTLNPLSAGSDLRANGSFAEGNTDLTNGGTTGEANGQKCQGTIGFANGKWYWEVKLISNTMTAGIVDSDIQTSADINLGSKNAVTYDSETGNVNNSSGTVYTGSTYDDGDIIGVAVDADNGAVYFAKNNTYQNSGNPASGASKTGGATFTLGNHMLPLAADNSSGSAGNHQYNFGNAPFSISSGNADANGYGNFEYAPPSGYHAICTKNLAEYG
jgi:hypothetical protein